MRLRNPSDTATSATSASSSSNSSSSSTATTTATPAFPPSRLPLRTNTAHLPTDEELILQREVAEYEIAQVTSDHRSLADRLQTTAPAAPPADLLDEVLPPWSATLPPKAPVAGPSNPIASTGWDDNATVLDDLSDFDNSDTDESPDQRLLVTAAPVFSTGASHFRPQPTPLPESHTAHRPPAGLPTSPPFSRISAQASRAAPIPTGVAVPSDDFHAEALLSTHSLSSSSSLSAAHSASDSCPASPEPGVPSDSNSPSHSASDSGLDSPLASQPHPFLLHRQPEASAPPATGMTSATLLPPLPSAAATMQGAATTPAASVPGAAVSAAPAKPPGSASSPPKKVPAIRPGEGVNTSFVATPPPAGTTFKSHPLPAGPVASASTPVGSTSVPVSGSVPAPAPAPVSAPAMQASLPRVLDADIGSSPERAPPPPASASAGPSPSRQPASTTTATTTAAAATLGSQPLPTTRTAPAAPAAVGPSASWSGAAPPLPVDPYEQEYLLGADDMPPAHAMANPVFQEPPVIFDDVDDSYFDDLLLTGTEPTRADFEHLLTKARMTREYYYHLRHDLFRTQERLVAALSNAQDLAAARDAAAIEAKDFALVEARTATLTRHLAEAEDNAAMALKHAERESQRAHRAEHEVSVWRDKMFGILHKLKELEQGPDPIEETRLVSALETAASGVDSGVLALTVACSAQEKGVEGLRERIRAQTASQRSAIAGTLTKLKDDQQAAAAAMRLEHDKALLEQRQLLEQAREQAALAERRAVEAEARGGDVARRLESELEAQKRATENAQAQIDRLRGEFEHNLAQQQMQARAERERLEDLLKTGERDAQTGRAASNEAQIAMQRMAERERQLTERLAEVEARERQAAQRAEELTRMERASREFSDRLERTRRAVDARDRAIAARARELSSLEATNASERQALVQRSSVMGTRIEDLRQSYEIRIQGLEAENSRLVQLLADLRQSAVPGIADRGFSSPGGGARDAGTRLMLPAPGRSQSDSATSSAGAAPAATMPTMSGVNRSHSAPEAPNVTGATNTTTSAATAAAATPATARPAAAGPMASSGRPSQPGGLDPEEELRQEIAKLRMMLVPLGGRPPIAPVAGHPPQHQASLQGHAQPQPQPQPQPHQHAPHATASHMASHAAPSHYRTPVPPQPVAPMGGSYYPTHSTSGAAGHGAYSYGAAPSRTYAHMAPPATGPGHSYAAPGRY
ncbi:hypothetical protein H696_01111 [Fonticula alba]|uniref:Uncharacterized protein n=1 Tax=Fonticula alba TaxID=691883 RepID=A0A058ZE00_FONAL|nr:hypothetical protein H696_01111 [Fonticula alba]KCV71687.1 hypothetical protein H696_01111 [Fonticula alba]|eukprot:XP_009493265.1 hypothetical protein H696_01111 [Fonticula alba]